MAYKTITKRKPRIVAQLFLLALVVATSACSRHDTELHQEQFFAFGTLVEISLYQTDQALVQQAIDAARNDFDTMHRDWHAWHPGALTQVNTAIGNGVTAPLDNRLSGLLDVATRLSTASGGLFNPAIGKLVALWGFQQDEFSVSKPPDEEKVHLLVQKNPDMSAITFGKDTISSSNSTVQFDLGAVAKGYGVGKVADHLQDMGIKNAIVNCGGDMRAFGTHGNRPWRIGIRKPRGDGVLASLQIEGDESVFTSGDYERFFQSQGNRYHHILDPRSGYPAQGVTSVTVIHKDAATADAAATALFVAGPEHWHKVAQDMGIRYVLLIDSEGRAHMNPAMKDRLQFEDLPAPEFVVSAPL